MSPAMVDFRSPASSSSSKVQSNHHRSQSVATGATPSSPHYIFRSNGIPDPSPSMDRSNLVQGASAPTEKLSVPRFLKHRKRSGISRASPATIASDSGAGLGLGPFRSETLYAVPFDRAEDSGTQFVREQLYGWKPFESDSLNRSSYGTGFVFSAASSGSNASSSNTGVGSVKNAVLDVCEGGRGHIEKEMFVFGRGMEKVSSWSSSSSQSSSRQDLGNANSAKLNIFETGIPVGGSVSSLSEGNVFSDKGAFVFRASGKNDGNLCHSRSLGSDNDLFYKLNSSKNVDEKSGKLDSVLFVHRNGEKKSTHPNKNSPFVSGGDVSFNEQSDRTEKKDLGNSGDVDCHNANAGIAEANVGLDQTSTMCSNGSSFSSITKLPEDLMKLKIDTSENGANGNKDAGAFVFCSGVSNSNRASKSLSFELFDGSLSKLPQKMEKLNLHGFVGEVHGEAETGVDGCLKKHAPFSEISSSGHDAGGFSRFTGESKNQNLHRSGNEEPGNDNHSAFIFGSDDIKNANLGNSSFPNFDESSVSNLPDQMKNMKLNNSGIEDDSQKSKPGNARNQHDNIAASSFISHSSGEDYGSRVAPLHVHNSCRLRAEPTSIPSVQPAFQTSVDHLYSTNIHSRSETPMEFKSQKPDFSLLTKENIFTKPHKNMASAKKKEDSKAGLRNKRGKSRNSTPIHTAIPKQFVSVDKHPEENQGQDSTGRDSPMDYSPYQETIESKNVESIHFDSRCASNDTQISGFANSKEGELFSAVEHFDTNESLHDNKEADCFFRVSSARHSTSMAINENVESAIEEKSSSMESESFSYDSSVKQPTNESESTFNSRLQDAVKSNFMFTATSSANGPSSSSKHNYRRKSKINGGHEPLLNFNLPLASPHSNLSLFSNAHMPTDPKQELKGSDDGVRAGKVHATKLNQESVEDACEKWRLRGNQAYSDGNLTEAEEFYSRGVDSFLVKEISNCCNRALMLCYSNRAATLMSLGRLREALNDCKMAVSIDPNFLRARVRAGNIHLSLGEPADALQHFEKVLQLDKQAKSDQKILLEAVDGIEKIQKLNDLTDQSSTFLTKRIPDDATKALEIISEALSIAPHSEILLEMKAEALVKLRNFDEAIQICEQTLEFAEKNTSFSETDCQSKDANCSKSMERSDSRFWRWRIISKSYFYLGKLEEANELLQKHEKVKPVIDKYWNRYPESSASFPVTIRELLRLKTAGNEAFQAGKHLEAVELYTAALALNTESRPELYTAALALNTESRPFSAICFCNRAAAYQALGQITDAIADCSLAIALDSTYKRAISRRATLHEMIRDYGQAATDLRKLTSLLEMHSDDKSTTSGALGRSSSNMTDLNQARMRLSTVEEEARKGGTLDMYMILGLERSCSATDVRKAYRKAALRHHPDKAGQFLARSENGDDRVWREIAEEVHSDADRLFKMIGEAYAILVDPCKRLQYDTEEELRTMKKAHGGSGSPITPASNYSSHHWRSYGSSYRRR